MVKVLGVMWDPQEDRLHFPIEPIAETATTVNPTKRNVVRVIGKFHDPLGFLAPVIIRFKQLFQKLCQSKLQWDEGALTEIRQRFWIVRGRSQVRAVIHKCVICRRFTGAPFPTAPPPPLP